MSSTDFREDSEMPDYLLNGFYSETLQLALHLSCRRELRFPIISVFPHDSEIAPTDEVSTYMVFH